MSAKSDKKGGSSFLARQKAKRAVTEDDLLKKETISPEDVSKLNRMTKNYLCRREDNVYGVEFTRFKIRDMGNGEQLFEVAKPPDGDVDKPSPDDPNAGRYVQYEFPPDFLRLKQVGATVEFTVKDRPMNKFRMIERHYFKDKVLKTFDFDFGFCIPNSTNTCEHIYDFPHLSESQIKEMVECPYETQSDSFYFVDDKLIMHNKAYFSYRGGLEAGTEQS
ncbi:protein unc-119 homolog B-like [Corticium candelabrum]|uniref:protein unc-119 homolog B-like n=1 Tax=Corticium candelabrum TaxID=121492 RepID=UPI002E274D33|nr:protein unc-119 homolog B-like [Corticium candelabrum]